MKSQPPYVGTPRDTTKLVLAAVRLASWREVLEWRVSSSIDKGYGQNFHANNVPSSFSSSAACTIFTPVGPPLLLASILFGGGATAVNAGSEAVNYRCEPNKMADRILTLHSIISSIANIPTAMDQDEKIEEEKRANLLRAERTQSRLHFTRAAMNGLKPLTSGALSAISIVTEARELKNTVDRIRAGNPCEKAERLAGIKNEVFNLPKTEVLSSQLWMIISRLQTSKADAEEVVDAVVPAMLSQDGTVPAVDADENP